MEYSLTLSPAAKNKQMADKVQAYVNMLNEQESSEYDSAIKNKGDDILKETSTTPTTTTMRSILL